MGEAVNTWRPAAPGSTPVSKMQTTTPRPSCSGCASRKRDAPVASLGIAPRKATSISSAPDEVFFILPTALAVERSGVTARQNDLPGRYSNSSRRDLPWMDLFCEVPKLIAVLIRSRELPVQSNCSFRKFRRISTSEEKPRTLAARKGTGGRADVDLPALQDGPKNVEI